MRSKGLGGSRGIAPKKTAQPPEGFSRSPRGTLRVIDPAYMKALHDPDEPALDVGIPPEGPPSFDLHHGVNPQGAKRRDNDGTVVKLRSSVHMFVEANPREEKALQRVFSCFAAFRYWAWRRGLSGSGEDAIAFHRWVQERMEEEA